MMATSPGEFGPLQNAGVAAANLLERWGPCIATVLGGLALAVAGFMKFETEEEVVADYSWWFLGAGGVLAITGAIFQECKSMALSKLRAADGEWREKVRIGDEEKRSLEGELRQLQLQLADAPRITSEVVRTFVRGYLMDLGITHLGFAKEAAPNRRLTLYSRTGDGRLYRVARHSNKPAWMDGRDFIAADRGITSRAWEGDDAFANDFADPDGTPADLESYVQRQVELGLTEDEARGLSMKSRLYYAVRVMRPRDVKPMAILVFESTDPDAFDQEHLRKTLNAEKVAQYRTLIVELLHEHFPDPVDAQQEGF